MATGIINLKIESWDFSSDSYQGFDYVYVIGWYRNRVVGTYWLPVVNASINLIELEDIIFTENNFLLWNEIALESFGIKDDPFPPLKQPVSIVVCTRNRPEHLKRCLDGFMALKDDGQEFIVVDNAPSSNASKEIVETYGGRVRYVRENRPGLNVARNTAIRAASHDIVIFNDDDAVPDPNWARALVKNFTNPQIMCVCGLTLPLQLMSWEQENFERFTPFQKGFDRRHFVGRIDNVGHAGRVGAGANMAFRKEVFDHVGLFDEALDAGTLTRSGGDTEMFARILFNHFDAIYDPSAVSWHMHRSGDQELHKTMHGYGVGIFAMWTRMLLKEKNWQVFSYVKHYFLDYQLNHLRDVLNQTPNSMPLDLILAEIRGCMYGPLAYLQSSRKLRRKKVA
ncbi:MAG: glycosyltransferase family 2 protein [Anaerolineae bacterium]